MRAEALKLSPDSTKCSQSENHTKYGQHGTAFVGQQVVVEFCEMQTKKLQNECLALLVAAGFQAQEAIDVKRII